MLRLTEFAVVTVEETSQTYGVLCAVAEELWTKENERSMYRHLNLPAACGGVGCLCTWEEGDTLRQATPEEARNWFGGMKQLAAQAITERDRNL